MKHKAFFWVFCLLLGTACSTQVKIVVIVAFILFAGSMSAQTQLWVSPSGSGYAFSEKNPGSLEGNSLRYKIIALRNSEEHNIQVILKEGVYALNTPVVVSNAMAGSPTDTLAFIGIATNPDTNGGKAIISGGKQVTGWQDAGDGIYKTQLPAGADFRQLYVNGKMAIRARHPNRDNDTNYGPYWKVKYFYNNDNTKMLIDASEIQQWSNMSDVEMVIHQDWMHNRAKVNSFETRGVNAIVSINMGLTYWGETNLSYFWENSLDFLDAEGEWYFDKSTRYLYYKPLANEDLNQIEVSYPVMDRLLTIAGAETTPVQNVYLQNIEFKYGNWAAPSIRGIRSNQGVILLDGDISVETMLQVSYAHNVRIVNCNIVGAGGNGIVFDVGVKNSEITACHFDQMAASGILIDAHKVVRTEALHCTDNRIAHNLIENFGMNYSNGYSLLGGSVSRLTVEHNEIRNARYSGLHIGNANPVEVLHDNRISCNNIHHVMWLHNDGGGIYTTANMPGTQLTHNWIHDMNRGPWVGGAPAAAIFLDDYSAWITVEDNVLQTELIKVRQQSDVGADRNAHDNTLRNNDSEDPAIIANAGAQIPTGVVTSTIPVDDREFYYVHTKNEGIVPIESNRIDSVKVEGELPALLNFYKENVAFHTLDIANIDSIRFVDDSSAIQLFAYPIGIPHAPGIIEAEDFDYGGEGVAYHDSDGMNGGDRSYRTDPGDQGVDIQKGANYYSNDFCVSGIMFGEWLKYTIHVPETGEYAFSFWTLNDRITSLDLLIDGGEPVGRVTIPNSNWAVVNVTGPKVQISEGRHVVTLLFNGSFGLDKFEFLKQ